MKVFTTLFQILVFSTLSLSAFNCTELPTTKDVLSPETINTSGAVDIANLEGLDCVSARINNFKIKTLPNLAHGTLYLADGVTAVTLNQLLTIEETDFLKFDPVDGFVGNASFTYSSIDFNSVEDATPATVTIPVASSGEACSEAPTTDDKVNPSLLNSSTAINILNLSGKDCSGENIEKFKIITLPNSEHGILYMADGTTAVTINQVLTLEEANGLRFDPVDGFVGNSTFTYVAIDSNDILDTTPATVTIPVVAPTIVGGACSEAPTTDDKVNPSLLNNLTAVNILNLSGKDCSGENIEKFKIITLPNSEHGILYMADGTTAVTINQVLTLEEANGLRFDPVDGFVGNSTFTYVSIDGDGNIDASPATVTIPLIDVLAVTDIVTNPDTGIAHGNADPITIDVLANDTGTLDGASVHLVNTDGTLTNRIVVEGEGVWTVNPDNTITFTPVAPFVGTPSPVNYLVEDANGARSNPSVISIAGECICSAYETSVPSLSGLSLLLLFILIPLIGVFLIRKEEFKSNL